MTSSRCASMLVLLVGCAGAVIVDPPSDTDIADTDAAKDTDLAGETDAVVDTDGASDTDAADTDVVNDSDVAADTDVVNDSDVAADTDTDTDVDSDVDTDTDSSARCGDGRVTPPEECDDQNDIVPYDGCTGCRVDNGWWCYGEPSYCVVL